MVDKNTAVITEAKLSSDSDLRSDSISGEDLMLLSTSTRVSNLVQHSSISEIPGETSAGSGGGNNFKMPNKKEFVKRLISSLAFIPIILILVFGSFEVVAALCATAFAFLGYEIFSPKIKSHILLRFSMLALCAAGILCFMYFRRFYGASSCIFLVCVASLTDTGAYCVGKLLKGPKLCPKISPMKTWSGFFGGFLVTDVVYCISGVSLFHNMVPALKINAFIVLQFLILSAVLGDLIESAFKRKIGVKDMSNLFPGHGGLLDRLDSLVGVSIVAFLFNYVFGTILCN